MPAAVYLSVHDVEIAAHVPHLAAKIAIEGAIRASGVPYTILRPNNFYQNDLWWMDVVRDYGVYPQPIGERGISRVDARDIADAAVNALTGQGDENRTYNLVGPEPLTGGDCARIFAEALGRPVVYGGNDLLAWSAQAAEGLPAWMVYDLALMYEVFQRHGLHATPEQVAETTAIAGHPPRAFCRFRPRGGRGDGARRRLITRGR